MSAEGFFGPGEQSLVDMIQMWGVNKATGILTVTSGKELGEVHFDGGKVVWAKAGPYLAKEDAIYHLLALEEGRFRFVNTFNIKRNGSWATSYRELIMEGMIKLDHLNSERRWLKKKFGFIPHVVRDVEDMKLSDEENVFLSLIDGRKNLEKVFNNCGLGLHKSLEIFNRFHAEGVIALRKVRVLVVDDQAVWRKIISQMLLREPHFEIAGTAVDGIDALRKLSELKPDVMTLDLEMPKLDGIRTLYWMMSGGYDILLKSHFDMDVNEIHRCPVVVISAVATKMAPETLEALMGGASGYITKPSQTIGENLGRQQHRIAKTVLMASQVDLFKSRRIRPKDVTGRKEFPRENARKLVCAGASMVGGLTALMQLIPDLPAGIDASVFVVIDDLASIDHARSFADFLDRHSEVRVLAADRNSILKKGTVYISPGSESVVFGLTSTGLTAFKVNAGRDRAGNFRPIDEMLHSAVRCKGFDRRLGVVLAGDGRDGKVGFLEMAKFGEKVFAQDSYSSLNPVKPEIVASTGVAKVVPLEEMVKMIVHEMNTVVTP